MTYSIVARDPETGELGVAVQSRYFSTGSVVTWAEAGVGAVATQATANIDYGPEGVALMRLGLTAPQALAALVANDGGRELRQVAMIDAQGNVAAHTGKLCIASAGHIEGDQFSVQANIMVDDAVVPAMAQAYRDAAGDLRDRMLAALDAAQAAGGDLRGQQSAAILVVSGRRSRKPWRGILAELRIEDHPRPLEELRRLVRLQRAYAADPADDGADATADQAMRFAEFAPDNDEFQLWAALSLFGAGREAEAEALFRSAFATNPALMELVARLVPLGRVRPGDVERIRAFGPS